jgi:hypothetical protein
MLNSANVLHAILRRRAPFDVTVPAAVQSGNRPRTDRTAIGGVSSADLLRRVRSIYFAPRRYADMNPKVLDPRSSEQEVHDRFHPSVVEHAIGAHEAGVTVADDASSSGVLTAHRQLPGSPDGDRSRRRPRHLLPQVVATHGRSGPAGHAMMVGVVAALMLACSRADSQRVDATAKAKPAESAPAVGPLAASSAPYRVDRSITGGRITGSVTFDGPAPTDSIVHPTIDADVCGQTIVDASVDHRGPHLASAVVWIDGVSAGKPLPVVRRYDLTTEGCQLVPRVQAAVMGGTLDVRNADQTTHLTRFIRAGSRALLAMISETEAGAVVPSRPVLAAPGLVEVLCDPHPWSKAWIAVFDQPYFATSDANGAFTIDSVPPGRYRITVWHERFGTKSDSVTVSGNATVAVEIKFRLQGPGTRDQ